MVRTMDRAFTRRLTEWYRENRRDLPWRRDRDPYHVWVSEIMLQQTRVEAVKGYYQRFMSELPDIGALASADERNLLKLWEGLGYYNRVRNMQKAAKAIVEKSAGRFPSRYEDILNLPGIGEYTAGAVASICFDQKTPAVDGNVLRVMSRLQEDRSDMKSASVKKRIRAYLEGLYPDSGCGDFTQGLIELGALICIPKGAPKCGACPVSDFCVSRERGTAMELPVKSVKKERRKVKKTVLLLYCADKLAVRQRGKESLLAGMYEFPSVDEELNAEQALRLAESWNCEPLDLLRETAYTHVFSHVEWDMKGYVITCRNADERFHWADEREMAEEIPLPSAFQFFLK